jgi:hypothetical protein
MAHSKKDPKVDIHEYSRFFFLLSLAIVLLMTNIAMEWRTNIRIDLTQEEHEQILYEFEETVIKVEILEEKQIQSCQ